MVAVEILKPKTLKQVFFNRIKSMEKISKKMVKKKYDIPES